MMSDLKIKASPEPEFIEEICDDQIFVDGTYYYYFDSPKWPHTIIDFEFSHDPGVVIVTVEGTLFENPTYGSDGCPYTDVTNEIFGRPSFVNSGTLDDDIEKLSIFRFARLKVVVDTGGEYIVVGKIHYKGLPAAS